MLSGMVGVVEGAQASEDRHFAILQQLIIPNDRSLNDGEGSDIR